MSKKVLFLDYDDVVNKAMWKKRDDGVWVCAYNFPRDGKVNDEQAVQWVSEFCEKYGYSIVVSSTWRRYDNYKECLLNAGLREGIAIDGATPVLNDIRGVEITQYLKEHREIEEYMIFDDMDKQCFPGHDGHFVWVSRGSFDQETFLKACGMHDRTYPNPDRIRFLQECGLM